MALGIDASAKAPPSTAKPGGGPASAPRSTEGPTQGPAATGPVSPPSSPVTQSWASGQLPSEVIASAARPQTGFEASAPGAPSTAAPSPAPAAAVSKQPAPAPGPAAVILAVGPGGTAYDAGLVEQLAGGLGGAGMRASVTGSASGGFSLDEVAQRARDIAQRGGRPTLVVQAHGKPEGDAHAIEIAPDRWVPSGVLFSRLGSELGDTPADVFMTSCHGGAASEAANRLLPPGSTFVALAPASNTVAGADVEALARQAQELSLDLDRDQRTSASELLFGYLTKALRNRIAPEVTVSGQGTRRLGDELSDRVGKPFSPEERARIDDALVPLVGADETARIVEAIRGSSTEWSIPAADYGKALAACFAAGPPPEAAGIDAGSPPPQQRAKKRQQRTAKPDFTPGE